MQELNSDVNQKYINNKDEIISFKCDLHENLQQAMSKFVEDHPNWDQYRILQAAIAGFLTVSYTHLTLPTTPYV